MSTKDHWDKVYAAKPESEFSWTQDDPAVSLALIRDTIQTGRVLDVGGSLSPLPALLLNLGYHVSVLDISPRALARAQSKFGNQAAGIHWIEADITAHPVLPQVDLWHDRAVFHFLTSPQDRDAYKSALKSALSPGGHAIIATFSLAGPDSCSGLPVQRYSPETLASELGSDFHLVKSLETLHLTPWGSEQAFQFSLLQFQPFNL